MIRQTEFKLYHMDNEWNRIGKPIRDDFPKIIIDRIQKVTVVFEDETTTTITSLRNFEYDSEYEIVITDALFNMTLYNAFGDELKIKRMVVEGIALNLDDGEERKYCFKTAYRHLKISRYVGECGFDTAGEHVWTFADINDGEVF